MITATLAYTYKLTAVYDLREWDEDTGSYLPLDDDQKAVCANCGKLHAKVYEVTRDQDGMIFTVGSSCSRKHFNGWVPEDKEVKRLAKEAEKLAKSKAHQKLVDIAVPIAEEVKALSLPKIIELERRDGRIPQTTWGTEDGKAKVWGLTSDGLTSERRECLYSSWMQKQVVARLEVLYPRTSELYAEDKNATRRFKLQQIALDLLGVW